jgi:hypothetical protein
MIQERHARRRIAAVLAAVLLLAFAATAGAQEVDEDEAPAEARLDTALGGYTLQASGTPLEVLVEEPVAPVPVDPGQPHLSGQTAYTLAQLQTGPSGRALASSAWPGALLGEGFGTVAGTITGDDDMQFPVMADARYPAGPEEAEAELPGGLGMRAMAKGLDVRAMAQTGEVPEALGFAGQFSSDSRSQVLDDHVVARARSLAQDVVLLDGLIRVGSVVTDITSTSTPEEGVTGGATEVSGLAIAGFGYAVDEDGIRPVQDGAKGGPLPLPTALATPDEVREALGIDILLLEHEEAIDDFAATRRAGGLRITIDTRVLRSALEEPVLQPLISSLPDAFVELPAYPLLFLAPKIDIVLGSATVSSAAVEQLTLDLDLDLDLDAPGEAVAPPAAAADNPAATTSPSFGSADASSGSGGGTASQPFVAAGDGEADDDGPPPLTAGSGDDGADLAATLPGELPGPGGVSIGMLALALLGAAGASRGLQGITASAFGLAGAGGGCDQGRPGGVPDLKSEGMA